MAAGRARINDDVASYIAQWSQQRELCRLCLTTRAMHAVVCPFIYRSLKIEVGTTSSDTILHTLRSNPAFGHHCSSPSLDNSLADDLLGCSMLLALLPNLKFLEITSWVGYGAIIPLGGNTTIQCSHLQTLVICEWDAVVDPLLALVPPIKRLCVAGFQSSMATKTSGLEQLLLRSVQSLERLEIDAEVLDLITARYSKIVWPNVHELITAWGARATKQFPNVRRLLEFPCNRVDQVATFNSEAWPDLELVSLWVSRSRSLCPPAGRPAERRVIGLNLYPVGEDSKYRSSTAEHSVSTLLRCFSADHSSSLVLTVQEAWNLDILVVTIRACRGLQYIGVRPTYHDMVEPVLRCLVRLDAETRLRYICLDGERTVEKYGESTVLGPVKSAVSSIALRHPFLKVLELKRAYKGPWAGGKVYRMVMRWRISRDAQAGVQLSTEQFSDANRDDTGTFSIFDLMSLDPMSLADVQMLH